MTGLIQRLRSAAFSFAMIAVLSVAGVFMWQDHLLYFPERASQREMLEPGLVAWPDAENFRGLLAEPPAPINVRGTAIVFHGNAGHAAHRRHYADALTALGLRVILAEYPGYGARDGKLGEGSLTDDAAASIALARKNFDGPLLVIGESLGAGVAAAATAKASDKAVALLLITPWDTLANVAAHHYPWLPVQMILSDRYDSVTNIRGLTAPVMVVVAEHDTIVPARFGRVLYERVTGPRRFVSISQADHNDWSEHVEADWWRKALEFLLPGNPPVQIQHSG